MGTSYISSPATSSRPGVSRASERKLAHRCPCFICLQCEIHTENAQAYASRRHNFDSHNSIGIVFRFLKRYRRQAENGTLSVLRCTKKLNSLEYLSKNDGMFSPTCFSSTCTDIETVCCDLLVRCASGTESVSARSMCKCIHGGNISCAACFVQKRKGSVTDVVQDHRQMEYSKHELLACLITSARQAEIRSTSELATQLVFHSVNMFFKRDSSRRSLVFK